MAARHHIRDKSINKEKKKKNYRRYRLFTFINRATSENSRFNNRNIQRYSAKTVTILVIFKTAG